MAILVNELAESIEKTTLTAASNVGKGSMNMVKAFYDSSQPLKVKLAEGLDLTCPFEPSAFKGTGAEDRVSIVFRTTDELYDTFATLEQHCRDLLDAGEIKHVNQLLCSCLRSDKYVKSIRTKNQHQRKSLRRLLGLRQLANRSAAAIQKHTSQCCLPCAWCVYSKINHWPADRCGFTPIRQNHR